MLCQITSNPYGDPNTVVITSDSLSAGSLTSASFARPIKLFTASEALITKRIAILTDQTFSVILLATIRILQNQLPAGR